VTGASASSRHLGDVVGRNGLIVDGDWVESKDQDPLGDVRLIQLADVGEGIYLDKSSRFLTREKARQLGCTFLKDGDILVARMPDPLGRACLFPGDAKPCVTVVDVCIIRPDPQIADPSWLCRTINSRQVRQRIERFIKGTTRQRISRSNLERVEIPVPSLSEQRRIAAILDKADDLRTKRWAALKQLNGLTQWVFLEMFGDPIRNPHHWELRDFDSTIRDETSKSDKLPQSQFLPQGPYPVIDQGQERVAGYCDDPSMLWSSPLPVVVFGDHTRVVKLVDHPFVVGADGAKVLVPQPGVEAAYLSWLIRLSPIPDLGYSRHMREVKRMKFPIPPVEPQLEFAKRLQRIEDSANRQRGFLNLTDALFASLEQRAFSGALRR
jgi:type I restriction enzyme S subunit